MDISPDSKWLACLVSLVDVKTQQSTRKVALLNLSSPPSPRLVDVHPHISGSMQFTPDGKAIAYPTNENGVDNLWVQPLDGSVGHQITKFKSDQISSFHCVEWILVQLACERLSSTLIRRTALTICDTY
jgi:eukaryotic-like serine/threonine-protein kinase